MADPQPLQTEEAPKPTPTVIKPMTKAEIDAERQVREVACSEEIKAALDKWNCEMEAIVTIGGKGTIRGLVEITAK